MDDVINKEQRPTLFSTFESLFLTLGFSSLEVTSQQTQICNMIKSDQYISGADILDVRGQISVGDNCSIMHRYKHF